MEQDNSLSKELAWKRQTSNQQSQQSVQGSFIAGSQVKEKLVELEQKLKSKAAHINQLEQTLDNLLSPRSSPKLSDAQAIENLCQQPHNLLKIL